MKPRKNTVLIMLLGLLLTAYAAGGIAQTPSQGDQKKAEACCAMESCCCNSGSCPMKEGSANAEAKEGCCCMGDSCEMKAKDGQNHADHPGCCDDSCKMKHDAKKHDAKGECCKIKQKNKARA